MTEPLDKKRQQSVTDNLDALKHMDVETRTELRAVFQESVDNTGFFSPSDGDREELRQIVAGMDAYGGDTPAKLGRTKKQRVARRKELLAVAVYGSDRGGAKAEASQRLRTLNVVGAKRRLEEAANKSLGDRLAFEERKRALNQK